MARNRANFKNERFGQWLQGDPEKYSHKPEISKNSKKIITEMHGRLYNKDIPHHELLLYWGREYEEKAAKWWVENEDNDLKECSFKPNIGKPSDPHRAVNWDQVDLKKKMKLLESEDSNSFCNESISNIHCATQQSSNEDAR